MRSVVLTELGIAIFENKKCVKAFPFSNPSEDYVSVKKGELRKNELLNHLQDTNIGISVSDESLLSILKKKSIDAHLMNEEDIDEIQSSKPQILVEAGFAKDEADAMSKLRDFAIQLSSSRVSEISGSPDLHVIQAINTLDEIDKIVNGISSRLREWYGLHFPELDNIIDNVNGYAQIVVAGTRENLSETDYKNAGFPDSKIEMLSLVTEKSRGGTISNENYAIVKGLAQQIIEFHKLRKDLEEHVQTQMKTIAPNLSSILGPSVGARILGRAGSLKKLGRMPASTIQVLGAEKALFRSLKTGSQPPKHGLLFQHALVHSAPRWQRGKIARAIAAKAAIASRVDIYGEGVNNTLLEKLNIRIGEIGEKYREPPDRPSKAIEYDSKKRSQKKSKNRFKSKKIKKKRRKFGRR